MNGVSRYIAIFLSLVLPHSLLAYAKSPESKPALKIAVVDTGVDFDHDKLQTFVRLPSIDDGRDETGHGTHIAGIIVQHLVEKIKHPNIEIVPIKYFSKQSNDVELMGSFSSALRKAIDLKVDIINVSVGGPGALDDELQLLVEAQQKGILVVAAAGNKKPSDQFYSFFPAAYDLPHVLSVVGTDNGGQILPTSNLNVLKNNLYFPGKNIRSTLPGNKFGLLTGSSQAAAQATAEIAETWLTKGREVVQQTYWGVEKKVVASPLVGSKRAATP